MAQEAQQRQDLPRVPVESSQPGTLKSSSVISKKISRSISWVMVGWDVLRVRQHILEGLEMVVENVFARLSVRQGPEILAEIRAVVLEHRRAAGHPLTRRRSYSARG